MYLLTAQSRRTPSGSQGYALLLFIYIQARPRRRLCLVLSATSTELVTMQVLLLLGSVSSLLMLVTGKCPPDKGYYWFGNYGIAYTNTLPHLKKNFFFTATAIGGWQKYTHILLGANLLPLRRLPDAWWLLSSRVHCGIGINGLTADNPLHCLLAGSSSGTGGGQWTGPDNTPVQCGGSGSGPLTCSQSSDPTNITLYYKGGAFSGKQLYTCTISGQSFSVQINREWLQLLYMYWVLYITHMNAVNQLRSAIYIEPPADVKSVPQNLLYCTLYHRWLEKWQAHCRTGLREYVLH